MTTTLIYDPAFLKHETGRHPENSERLRRIIGALESDPILWGKMRKAPPSAATQEDITRCHGEALIHQIKDLCDRGEPFVDLDTRISPESYEVARLAAGAAVTAVDLVMNGG